MRLRLAGGAAITGAFVAIALVSIAWTPEPPTHMRFGLRLKPPLAAGLFGTDSFGRDVLSMLMAGATDALAVAAPAVLVGSLVGTGLGIAAAGRRGLVDAAIMRACDVMFAVPPILSALLLGALLGPGRVTAIVAISVFIIPVFARVARGEAARVWGRDYVAAARGAGKGRGRIALEHVLPNVAGQLLVQLTLQLGLAVLTEAGLSYLGLGAPPPAPSWGRMLADAQTYLGRAPWLAIAPGACVAAVVLGFNLLGDGLRDRLDRRGDGAP